MLIQDRTYSPDTNSYRFGFNGKEQDCEISGQGNVYDYGFRIYNSRLGKFLSVDPLFKSYPWYTPYQFAGNKVIIAKDLDGLEEKHSNEIGDNGEGEVIQDVTNYAEIYNLLQDIKQDLNKSWDDAFLSNGNTRETGGAIIKDADGNYSIHRYKISKRSSAISLKRSRRGIPKGFQLVGDFHTHPWNKKDLLKAGWKNSDGFGMLHSRADFISGPKREGYLNIVYSGTAIYVVEITDKKKYKKFTESGRFDMTIPYVGDLIDEAQEKADQVLQDNPDVNESEVFQDILFQLIIEKQNSGVDMGFNLIEICTDSLDNANDSDSDSEEQQTPLTPNRSTVTEVEGNENSDEDEN